MKIELALPLLSAPLMRSSMHCNLYHSVKCLAYFRDLRFVLVPTYLYKTLMASLRFSPVSFRCSYALESGENETDWQTQLVGVCICRHSVSTHKFETHPGNVAITPTSKENLLPVLREQTLNLIRCYFFRKSPHWSIFFVPIFHNFQNFLSIIILPYTASMNG